MPDKKEIKKYCSGIDCLTCGEAEPCIYRIANKLQEQLQRKEEELRNICKAFDIEYVIDKETGSLIGRCNKLNKKEQECEELKKQVCGLRPELKSMIDKICCKYNVEAKNYHEKIIEIINNLDKYKQALDIIEEYCMQCNLRWDFTAQIVLNIINKTREIKRRKQ